MDCCGEASDGTRSSISGFSVIIASGLGRHRASIIHCLAGRRIRMRQNLWRIKKIRIRLSQAEWRSASFLKERMRCTASGSANIKRLIVCNEGALNVAVERGGPLQNFLASCVLQSGDFPRPDRAAHKRRTVSAFVLKVGLHYGPALRDSVAFRLT